MNAFKIFTLASTATAVASIFGPVFFCIAFYGWGVFQKANFAAHIRMHMRVGNMMNQLLNGPSSFSVGLYSNHSIR